MCEPATLCVKKPGVAHGKVVLHVCGGVAAYKACEVLRSLQRAGCEVRVAMTADACEFVAPTTFAALSGHPVTLGFYGQAEGAIPHISLSSWADVQLVVPCTANMMAKLATGLADDVVCATLLAARGPVVVAPAMNERMWQHVATQQNVSTLEHRGVRIVAPEAGHLACGDVGKGKLAKIDAIAKAVLAALDGIRHEADFTGCNILVTAGPTHEAIDPVRFIANASSGKMGYAVAAAAVARGASVTLVSGPVSLVPPAGTTLVAVRSASEMHAAALAAFERAHVAICAAAVADYTPAHPASHKLKKAAGSLRQIELVQTPDILAELAAAKGARVVVGFAAETDNLVSNARVKLSTKGCDLIVANDVSRADSTFGADTNAVTFVTARGDEALPCLPKEQVAHELLDRVAELLRREG